jgi:thiol-disulfide isomerase/thioredoxin
MAPLALSTAHRVKLEKPGVSDEEVCTVRASLVSSARSSAGRRVLAGGHTPAELEHLATRYPAAVMRAAGRRVTELARREPSVARAVERPLDCDEVLRMKMEKERAAVRTGMTVFSTDEPRAVAEASRSKKLVLIYFGASWCAACAQLESRTFPDDELRRVVRERFVAVYVDATDDDDPRVAALGAKYRVQGLPTLIVADASGKERLRIIDFVEAAALRRALEGVVGPVAR